jgi:rhodanese-related sulfurtransferase
LNTSFPFISMLSKVKMVISKIGRLKGVSMSFKSISVADAAQSIKNGVLVIDVREQNEYDQVHIENSVLVPLSKVSAKKINEINPQNKTILIHCHAGKRSKVAANIILSQGYAGEILELDEGISAWIEFGQKIIS